MTKVRVKGIKEYLEPKTGRVYVYHRKTGFGSRRQSARQNSLPNSLRPKLGSIHRVPRGQGR